MSDIQRRIASLEQEQDSLLQRMIAREQAGGGSSMNDTEGLRRLEELRADIQSLERGENVRYGFPDKPKPKTDKEIESIELQELPKNPVPQKPVFPKQSKTLSIAALEKEQDDILQRMIAHERAGGGSAMNDTEGLRRLDEIRSDIDSLEHGREPQYKVPEYKSTVRKISLPKRPVEKTVGEKHLSKPDSLLQDQLESMNQDARLLALERQEMLIARDRARALESLQPEKFVEPEQQVRRPYRDSTEKMQDRKLADLEMQELVALQEQEMELVDKELMIQLGETLRLEDMRVHQRDGVQIRSEGPDLEGVAFRRFTRNSS